MTETALEHPGDEVLRALSLGQLTAAELARVSTHLGDCPACCRRIDQLTTDDHLLGRLQQIAASQEQVLVGPVQRRRAVRTLLHSEEGRSATRKPDPQIGPVIRPAPKVIGDYDVLSEVGRGGMGVVFKARHRGLHRLAAVKMVLAGEFASPAQELRFRLEAELGARVLHPNIVQVYEIGNYDGRPFLALEWVEGGSLANRMDGKPWPPGDAASLIETLARAINLAHDEGVIHRDLKPANIMLAGNALRVVPNDDATSTHDGVAQTPVPQALVPKITDFGLAQTIEGGPTMTQNGFLVGTPGYMAPEQASGQARPLWDRRRTSTPWGWCSISSSQGNCRSRATAPWSCCVRWRPTSRLGRAACGPACHATWKRSRYTAWRRSPAVATQALWP